jgi:hypothetical protein
MQLLANGADYISLNITLRSHTINIHSRHLHKKDEDNTCFDSIDRMRNCKGKPNC